MTLRLVAPGPEARQNNGHAQWMPGNKLFHVDAFVRVHTEVLEPEASGGKRQAAMVQVEDVAATGHSANKRPRIKRGGSDDTCEKIFQRGVRSRGSALGRKRERARRRKQRRASSCQLQMRHSAHTDGAG
jgi:hypothetical protein